MLSLEAIILSHPFFEEIEPAQVNHLVECASHIRFHAEDILFRAGDSADHFYIIKEGKISLDVSVPGRGSVSIQTIYGGDVIGWSWLFPPYEWQFDARAMQDTQAVAFDGRSLRELCASDHEIGYQLMQRFAQVIAQRLQATRLQLLDIYAPQA